MNRTELKLINEKEYSSDLLYSKESNDSDQFLKSPNSPTDILQEFSANLNHLESLQNQFRFMTLELKEILS